MNLNWFLREKKGKIFAKIKKRDPILTISIVVEPNQKPVFIVPEELDHLQKKRVSFRKDNLESFRIFSENLPPTEFCDGLKKKRVFCHSPQTDEAWPLDAPLDLLVQKEKKYFGDLSELFLPKSIFSSVEFKEEFEKLFFAPYFQLHLNHHLRFLTGVNELDLDLKDVVRGFVAFLNKLGSCDDRINLKEEIGIWIKTMLNASIYREGQTLLSENLDLIYSFFEKTHSRLNDLLNPSHDIQSTSYQNAVDFWFHFLSCYPKQRFHLENVIDSSHPVFEKIDSDLSDLIHAGGMWKELAEALVLDVTPLLVNFDLLIPLIESPHEILSASLSSMISGLPLVQALKIKDGVSRISIRGNEMTNPSFNLSFLKALLRSENIQLNPLKIKIILEYTILNLDTSSPVSNEDELFERLCNGLESFPIKGRSNERLFTIKGIFWNLFWANTPIRRSLEGRFWHSLYSRSKDFSTMVNLKSTLMKAGRNQ